MEEYNRVSYELCELLTNNYSTSFGKSSQFFNNSVKPHIYAIYAFARIGDEIVDEYKGEDASAHLEMLEKQTFDALNSGYSTNPIIYAFVQTANKHNIDHSLIKPFFDSMRMDLTKKNFDNNNYNKYIYGSAEVIGLMCLKVFTNGDHETYNKLKEGASALGSAYQKINFLRDLKADFEKLDRFYFPNSSYIEFGDKEKNMIIKDIHKDLLKAKPAMDLLPKNARRAVRLSYLYYSKLLEKLESSSVEKIKSERIRVNDISKLALYVRISGGF